MIEMIKLTGAQLRAIIEIGNEGLPCDGRSFGALKYRGLVSGANKGSAVLTRAGYAILLADRMVGWKDDDGASIPVIYPD